MYDVIIIGGGPSGYTAAMYSARARLKTLLIEKMFSGGQMATTDYMENYPGFDEPIGGVELALKMERQSRKFGTEILYEEVIEISIENNIKVVKTTNSMYECKALILCMGASPKTLGLEKEDKFRGAGVSYCAVCDAAFYRDKIVAIVGGGDTAAEDAIYLSKFSPKVYLIHRKETMRATKLLQEELKNNRKVEFIWNTVVEEIVGENNVEGIKVKNIKTNEINELKVNGLFIAIGLNPNTELVRGKIRLNDHGYILTDENMQTNIAGVYAAGDIRSKNLRQVITAAADGAISSYSAEKYISSII